MKPILALALAAVYATNTSQADAGSGAVIQQLNVRAPMRDGVMLSADIYRPNVTEPVPIILVRTPYEKSTTELAEQGQWWAERGYAFVAQDVRGRGDSDGEFYPLINEAADGFDSVEWAGKLPWSSGKVGMLGGSYLGWTQVYAAGQRSRYLKAIIPTVTPPDPDRNWPSNFGVMYLGSLGWLAVVDGRTRKDISVPDFGTLLGHLPVATLDAEVGRNLPVWRDWAGHAPGDAYWQKQSYQQKLLESPVPALHVGGWYDSVSIGATENFTNMIERGVDTHARQQQRLLMGPWEHTISAVTIRRIGTTDFGPAASIDFRGVQLRWFDHWLKGIDNGVDRDPRVKIFVTGTNRWIEENEWPIARTQYVKYHLRSGGKANSRFGDGRLSTSAPGAEAADHFRYDPADPLPFFNLFSSGSGPDNYRDAEARPDMLVYTSEAMNEPTLVCGPLRVKLFAATNARDTDWTARVLDVAPDGTASRLNDGIVRARYRKRNGKEELLTPGQVYDYDIEAWAACTELGKGHRVRLEIGSSMFPMWQRNLNTGGPVENETQGVVAQQTVFHDRSRASYLLLPVVPPRQ